MAATIKFRIAGEDVQYSFEVEESSGNVSITKVASAVKMMRQMANKTLNKYVEAEKNRGPKHIGKETDAVVSSKGMEDVDDDENEEDDSDDNGDDVGDDDEDNGGNYRDDVTDGKGNDEKSIEHCSPDSKKQRIEQ